MWCDNCLLVFPLRGGAIILALFIAMVNLIGGIILFKYGEFLSAVLLESQIEGGIAMASMSICIILIIGLANSNFLFTRLVFLVYPFILFVLAIRAGVMLFRLNAYQGQINWECQNGGALYNFTLTNSTSEAINAAETAAGLTARLPNGFCSLGFQAIYLAFALTLAIDIILQVYLYFLSYRFMARLRKYYAFSQTTDGIYTA